MTPSVIASGLLACTVSFIELTNARSRNPTWRAAFYVSARLTVDAGGGMVAFPLIVSVLGALEWFNDVWAVMLAGLCGPALLRSQLAWLGSGQEQAALGPANVLRRVQGYFEKQIDEIDAEAQSRWLNTKVLPRLASKSPEVLAMEMKEFLGDLRGMPAAQRDEICAFLDATVADVAADDEKRRAMAFKLLTVRGRRWLRVAGQC